MAEPRIQEVDGILDDLWVEDATSVHVERMDNTAWWIGIDTADGTRIHVNLGAVNQQAKPFAYAQVDEPDEDDTPQGG